MILGATTGLPLETLAPTTDGLIEDQPVGVEAPREIAAQRSRLSSQDSAAAAPFQCMSCDRSSFLPGPTTQDFEFLREEVSHLADAVKSMVISGSSSSTQVHFVQRFRDHSHSLRRTSARRVWWYHRRFRDRAMKSVPPCEWTGV